MIRVEINRLKTRPRDLRQFGLVVGGVFSGLALVFWLFHKPFYWYPLLPAAPLLVLGWVFPKSLKFIYIAWMALAIVLGHIMSTGLLTLLFFLVVTPLGLAARCFGRDFLNRRIEPNQESYWLARPTPARRPPSDYERQF